MRLNHKGELVRTDAWREGKYLDLWSVPHFLSGMVVALSLYVFGFEVRSAFVIAFLLLVGYEMFEVIAKIDETRWNRTLDVVVGMASVVPTGASSLPSPIAVCATPPSRSPVSISC